MSKVPLLLQSAASNPFEFYNRMAAILEVQWERIRPRPALYRPVEPSRALGQLEQGLGTPLQAFLQETGLAEIEQHIHDRVATLTPKAPFSLLHNADVELGRFCFALTRALRARVIVES